MIRIHGTSPHLADMGGGTLINVTGTGFRNFGDTRCRFGSEQGLTYATVFSRELLQCRTPAYALPMTGGRRELRLEVTLNGVDYTRSPTASHFLIYDHDYVRVSHLAPSGGPVRGDTRVTLHGHAFEGPGNRGARLPPSSLSYMGPSVHASCIWWRSNSSCIEGIDCRGDCARPGPCTMKVPATYIDRQTMVCVSPPAYLRHNTSRVTTIGEGANGTALTPSVPFHYPTPSAAWPDHETYHLDITFDDTTYTSLNTTYVYYNPFAFGVSHVDPIGGPANGGTAVLVLGHNFMRLGSSRYRDVWGIANTSTPHLDDGTYCHFAADPFSSNATVRVAATVVSSTRLLCRAPPFTGALTYHRMPSPVFVTMNGDEWARTPACDDCNFTCAPQCPPPRCHRLRIRPPHQSEEAFLPSLF